MTAALVLVAAAFGAGVMHLVDRHRTACQDEPGWPALMDSEPAVPGPTVDEFADDMLTAIKRARGRTKVAEHKAAYWRRLATQLRADMRAQVGLIIGERTPIPAGPDAHGRPTFPDGRLRTLEKSMTTDDLHCPMCHSTNVECQSKPHMHYCFDCGYDGTTSESDLGARLRSQANISARPGQLDALNRIATEADRLVAERDALRTQLDAAYSVIRRFLDWWQPDTEPIGEETFNRWYLEPGIDDTDVGGTEPMTPAEVEVIRRAREAHDHE